MENKSHVPNHRFCHHFVERVTRDIAGNPVFRCSAYTEEIQTVSKRSSLEANGNDSRPFETRRKPAGKNRINQASIMAILSGFHGRARHPVCKAKALE